MKPASFSSWTLAVLVAVVSVAYSAPPVIGMATARGSFYLDSVNMQGNATLFDGAVVETAAAPSIVRLDGGVRLQMASTSRIRVFRDRSVLEKGEGQLVAGTGYRIEAGYLRVLPDSPGTAGRVTLTVPGTISVAAASGRLRVTNPEGLLLAKVDSGTTLEFGTQAASAMAPTSVTGCLSAANGRILLTDATANVTFQVRGKDLARFYGQRVTITATFLKEARPGEGASQVVQVAQIKVAGRRMSYSRRSLAGS